MSQSKVDLTQLSAEQRLELLAEIWDSLTPEDVPLTSAQVEELRRRVEDLQQHPDHSVSWDDARRRIRDRLQ